MEWVAALALPAAIAATVIVLAMRTALRNRLIDRPNERSLHVEPTPRLGGLGVMAGSLACAAFFGTTLHHAVLACALLLCVVSALDDWRSLPVAVRLSAHLAAALVVAAMTTTGAWIVVIALGIVWSANLYNFMDGADGLAGLMATVGFGALAFAAASSGSTPLALVCACIASAAGGFLAFNFPPARVFMGDAGSVPLGFLAASLGVAGTVEGAWPSWFPLLVFSPFIVDATVTLVRRVVRGERAWIAHREHAYQRLVLAGWSAQRLAMAMAALMLCAATSALAAIRGGEMLQRGILFAWLLLYGFLVPALELKFPRDNKNRTGARQSNGAPGEQE